uniref:hypothetical protein n=1 Tax=Ilumatobacter nonamiensis TaxID=467093 RepID=UPI000591767C
SSVMGPIAIGGVEMPLSILEDGTGAVVKWMVRETDLGFGEVRNVAFVLAVFGLGIGVLHTRKGREDPDDDRIDRPRETDDAETIAQAEDLLERIETKLADGSRIEDLAGLIDDFGRLTRSLDTDRTMDILDDPRVLPPDIDVGGSTDID